MTKKQYIAPAMEVTELEIIEMLAASNLKFDVSDETTEDDALMSNDRRGSWGNLWN